MDEQRGTFHFRTANGARVLVKILGESVELSVRSGRKAAPRLNPLQAKVLRALVTSPAGRASEEALRRMHDHAGLGVKALKAAVSRTLLGLAKALGDSTSIATLKNQSCQLTCRVTELSLECPRIILGHRAQVHGRTSLSLGDSELAVYVSPHDGPESKRTFWHQGSGHVHGSDWVSLCRFGNEDWLDMPLRQSPDLDFSVLAVAVERSAALPGSDPDPAVSPKRFRQLLDGARTLAVAGPITVTRLFQPPIGPDRMVSPENGQQVLLGTALAVRWTPRERDMVVEVRFRGRAIFYDITSSGRPIRLEELGRYEVSVFHPHTPARKVSAWIDCVKRRR